MGRKEREKGEESRAEREKRWLLISHTDTLHFFITVMVLQT